MYLCPLKRADGVPNLSGDGEFVILLVSEGALVLIAVVKRHTDGRLGDAGLAVLVDELL